MTEGSSPDWAAGKQRGGTGSDGGTAAWVLHLPTTLPTLEAAMALVQQLRDCLGHLTVIDFGAATLSEKDRLMVRHQVFCGRTLPHQRRCDLRHEHHGPCATSTGGLAAD